MKMCQLSTAVDSEEHNSFDGTSSHWEFVVRASKKVWVVLRYYKEFLIFPFNFMYYVDKP